jgi:hypothetical protein
MRGESIFNVFIIGPMGITEKQLHNRPRWRRILSGRQVALLEHTVAIKAALESILSGSEAQTILKGQPYRIDIPDESLGADVMTDVFNKIDNADLIIADLFMNRPTVYYEMAMAHSLGVPVMILTGKGEKVAFYFQEMRIGHVAEYTPEAIAAVLRSPLLDFLSGQDQQKFTVSPFNKFFQAPIVEISAAAGLAAGYYVNMVRDVIFQKGGAVSQKPGLEKFYVIRLEDILTRQDDEERLRTILARVTGENKPEASLYNERFTRPTSQNRPIFAAPAGHAIVDLPTPLYSLFHAPRYQRLQARLGHDDPEAKRMRQRMIDAFFAALYRQINRDDTVSREKLEVVGFDELEARLGLR